MPNRIVLFPVLNGIQFFKEDKAQHPAFKTKLTAQGFSHYDNVNAELQLDKKPYYQKLRFDDFFTIQVHSNANYHDTAGSEPKLQLLDSNGNVLVTWGPMIYELPISGNVWTNPDDDTDTEQLITYQWSLSLLALYSSVSAGLYKLRYVAKWDDDDDGDTDYSENWDSEWIWAKESWPDTVYLRYSCATNNHGALFENNYYPRFAMRVNGSLTKYEPASTDVAYVDQGEDIVQLDSQPYDTYQFTATDIADYVQKKLNYIFACDSKSVDGLKVEKDDGAKFEVQRVEGYPLVGSSIKVRPARNTALTEGVSQIIEIGGTTPPYAIANWGISDGQIPLPLGSAIVVEDDAGGAALASARNLTLTNYGLTGVYAYSASTDKIQYTLGDGEDWVAFTGTVLPSFFRVYVTSAADDQSFYLRYKSTAAMVVDWGDGTIERLNSSSVSLATAAHQYATTDSFTIRIFHNDFVSDLILGDSSFIPDQVQLTSFDAQLPAYLVRFTVSNPGNLTNTTTLEPLKYCWRNLQYVICSNGLLTTSQSFCQLGRAAAAAYYVSEGYTTAQANGLATSNAFKYMIYVDLSRNTMSVSEVNSVITDIYTYARWQGKNGTLNTKNQTPAAAPTFTAAANKITMINNGWQVTTD